MNVTDPIADFLTRIRNASLRHQEVVEIPSSNMKRSIVSILKAEGFIKDYELLSDGPPPGKLRVYLKYGPGREKVIRGLRRISKPGRRVYAGKNELPRVLGGLGLAIVSTSQGVMSDKQARAKGLGGEVICYVW
ncbi:MAG: 30S ribosomal protein S8 [Clostridia bacterium]|nr:MAG: 30S ribosomal protein S8 [Clostridia bacterium]